MGAGVAASCPLFLGVDLGSTATKAVVVDGAGVVLGRSMVSSGANYLAAVQAAEAAAVRQARSAVACGVGAQEAGGCGSGGVAVVARVGTGYGRVRLPFAKEQIRSEIICHALGAHAMFPRTATVVDIGGQDTKVIQVDAQGLAQSFHMNDRCAAGCGRFLGYVAEALDLTLEQLGPQALAATQAVRINNTCTVFAAAECRSRLLLGQRPEEILAGVHRALALRVVALLKRAGGARQEVTLCGGVARNSAAVQWLRQLMEQYFGAITLNVSEDAVFAGAWGAALLARQMTPLTCDPTPQCPTNRAPSAAAAR